MRTIKGLSLEIQNIINMEGKELELGELTIKSEKEWETNKAYRPNAHL